jgi:methylamine dehydrogenase accessory protein MauD
MDMLAITVGVLWLVVLSLIVAVWALARQVGILFERVSPMGALMIDAGPKVGSASPRFDLTTLTGETLTLGGEYARSRLLFFLSPTCPVCKKLLPVLRAIRTAEKDWLEVVLASDGESDVHERFARGNDLQAFPYVLSTDLGMSFRVSRLPFAVLIGEDGIVKSKGLVNNREQLESLFRAKEMGVASVQDYISANDGSAYRAESV